MMTASVIRPQVTEGSIDFEMRRGKPCYWKGELPPRNYQNPVFSAKVFIGGVPWDITEPQLLDVSIVDVDVAAIAFEKKIAFEIRTRIILI